MRDAIRIGLALAWWSAAVGAAALVALALPLVGSPTRELAAAAAGTSVVLALVSLGGASLSAEPLALRLGLGPSRSTAGVTALLVAGFLGTSQLLQGILDLTALRQTGTLGEIDAALAGARGGELLLTVLALGVAPAIGEELFARGWIQRGLAPRIGAGGAIVAGAAVFGLLHADPVHSPAAFVLGLYLGAVALATSGLRVAILCHAVNNALAVATAAYGVGATDGAAPGGAAQVGVALAGAALGATALAVAFRRAHAPADPPGVRRPTGTTGPGR